MDSLESSDIGERASMLSAEMPPAACDSMTVWSASVSLATGVDVIVLGMLFGGGVGSSGGGRE